MRNFVYVAHDKSDAVVVDMRSDFAPWEKYLEAQQLTLRAVLLTHSHHDHVNGLENFAEKYDLPIYLGFDDAHRLRNKGPVVDKNLRFLSDSETLEFGDLRIQVIHTPGHSAGELSYFIPADGALFTGDTVFVGDVGRTDLPTGDSRVLFETVQKIKKLPQSTTIYPGHDYGKTPTTTIARELLESRAFQIDSAERFEKWMLE